MQEVFSYCVPTRIIHGPGSLERAGGELKGLGGKVALIVTDPGLVAVGLADRVRQNLEKSGICSYIFSGVKNMATLGAALAGREEGLAPGLRLRGSPGRRQRPGGRERGGGSGHQRAGLSRPA